MCACDLTDVEPIVARLVEAQRSGVNVTTLDARTREVLQSAVRRILVSPGYLVEHLKLLKRKFQVPADNQDVLPDDQVEVVLNRGLGTADNPTLDDQTFAALLLNTVALHDLACLIDEEMPEAWVDAMGEEGRRLIEKYHLPRSLEELKEHLRAR